MPASITMALVASRPKVIGSRMLMPESGPMPGSTPTSVPTRHPMNAYQRMSGRNATENPSSRLSSVSTVLEPEQAAFERRLQRGPEQQIGQHHHGDAVTARYQRIAALDADQQGEQQQDHGDQESELLIQRDRARGDDDDQKRMLAVIPAQVGKRRALGAAQDEDKAERHH